MGLPDEGAEDVQRGHHQQPCLDLGFHGQRHMHGHLISVEVGVVGGANQGMNPDGLTLDQGGFKRLNGQPVKRGRAIEQHGMPPRNLFQNVPDLR